MFSTMQISRGGFELEQRLSGTMVRNTFARPSLNLMRILLTILYLTRIYLRLPRIAVICSGVVLKGRSPRIYGVLIHGLHAAGRAAHSVKRKSSRRSHMGCKGQMEVQHSTGAMGYLHPDPFNTTCVPWSKRICGRYPFEVRVD
jgi:hypothetical protein